MKTTLLKIALALLLPIAAHAENVNWSGAGTDDLWSNGNNWSTSASPTTIANVTFNGTTRLSPKVNAAVSANRIGFGTTAGIFDLGGTGTISFASVGTGGSSAIFNTSSYDQTISANLASSTSGLTHYITATGGNLTISGNISANDNRLSFAGTKTITVTGNISGTGATSAVVNNNSDTTTLVLAGANTFTGGAQFNKGTSILQHNQALGAASSVSLTNSGAASTLLINGSYSTDKDIYVNSASTVATPGAATIGGMSAHTSTYSGNLTLDGRGSGAPSRNIFLTAAQGGIVNLSGTITTNGTAQTQVVNKTGLGTVILSNSSNTYTGPTNVSEGTLLVTGALAAATGNITVSANATLGGNGTIARDTTIKTNAILLAGNGTLGTLSLTGNLTLENNATLAFTLNADGSHSSLDLSAATLSTLPSNLTFSFATIGEIAPSTPFANLITGLNPATDTSGWRVEGLDGSLSFVGGALTLTTANIIPEPSTYALILASLIAITLLARRRKK